MLFIPLIFGSPAILTKFYLPRAAGLLSASVTVSGTFWMSLLASICVYRLSPWHPLAKYPGPILCKLSKFRLAYLCARGKQHVVYQTLHEIYGDVVRVGEPSFSLCCHSKRESDLNNQVPMKFQYAMSTRSVH